MVDDKIITALESMAEDMWNNREYDKASGVTSALRLIEEMQAKGGVVGQPCYKIYVRTPSNRFKDRYHDYVCDTKCNLNYWKRHNPSVLRVEEKTLNKSDRIKVGKTVFLTREEAERAIKPQTDCGWK